MPDQWEYRYLRIHFADVAAGELNAAGRDGWEVVAVIEWRRPGPNATIDLAHVAVLKRRL